MLCSRFSFQFFLLLFSYSSFLLSLPLLELMDCSVSLYEGNLDAMSGMLKEAQNEALYYKQKSRESGVLDNGYLSFYRFPLCI